MLLCASSAGAQEKALLDAPDIDRILKGLSEITGWSVRRRVPAEFISKDQLRGFVEQRIREEVKPKDIYIEELTLKMFGLAPRDFDLRKTTIDLVSEQAAAFYDPRKRKLSIIETPGQSGMEKRAALIHELAHAIADQHFHLERYIKKGSQNDDAETARQAVVEGQATWLMWAYANREGGGEAGVGASAMLAMDQLAETNSAQYPALAEAPLYLRESLLFPYTKGLAFEDAVFQKLGQRSFDEVFRRPPSSTREILHPGEYLAGREFAVPKPPPIPDEKRYRKVADGTLGEFDQYVLLRQFGSEPEAKQLSGKWRSGVFRLLESKRDKRPVLAFTAVWDSEESARAYFTAYEGVLRGKWKRFDVLKRSENELTGTGDRGAFMVRRDGAQVTSVEGLPEGAIH
jgi:hypothetical protein